MLLGVDASRSRRDRTTGTEHYSVKLIDALIATRGRHQLRLYSPIPPEAQSAGVDYVTLPSRRLWTHRALGMALLRRPPDALFVPAHVLPVSEAGRRVPRKVVTVHDVGYRHFPAAHPLRQRLYLDWSTRFTCRHADVVLADSQATRADLARFYGLPGTRCVVAYPGFEAPPRATPDAVADAAHALSIDGPFVVFVGTLQPRKNIARLLQAWAQVLGAVQTAPAPVLVLAGAQGWGNEDYAAHARALGIESRVRITGYVDNVRRNALLRGARALAFPSLFEGFGFPVLEAQAAGTPVVCSHTSSLPEVAGDAAIYVDPLSVDAIAKGLIDALTTDTAWRVEAGARNLTRFRWVDTAAAVWAAAVC